MMVAGLLVAAAAAAAPPAPPHDKLALISLLPPGSKTTLTSLTGTVTRSAEPLFGAHGAPPPARSQRPALERPPLCWRIPTRC
jgi:hypothetical protein